MRRPARDGKGYSFYSVIHEGGVASTLACAVELKAFLSCQSSGAFHCILGELYGAALRWASWAAMDSIPSSTCFAAASK
jgi:hypothetical protein